MAFNLGSVFIQIGANNAPLRKDLARTESIMRGFVGTAKSITGPLAGAFAIGAVVQDAISTITGFEQAVANLSSITGKSANDMQKLTDAAIQIGRVSSFTASQVVELQTELAKLGFTEGEILKSTKAIGDFSVAVGTDAASAAALGGAALRSFGLDASQAESVMNTLAVATTKSALDFSKLQTALPYVGTAAQQMGLSIEKTTAILGLLSDRGVRAETAGTSLRDILLDSAKAGLSFDDSLSRVANSEDKLKTATEIFGKTSAGAAVIIAENASQLNRLQASITGADGALKEMTDKRLDTAKGKLELATSAWEGFLLSVDKGDGVFSRFAKNALETFADFIDDLTVLNDSGIEGLKAKARQRLSENVKADKLASLPNVGQRGNPYGRTFQDELKGAQTVLDNLTKKLEQSTVGSAAFIQTQKDIAYAQSRVNELSNKYIGIIDNTDNTVKNFGNTVKNAKKDIPKEISFKIIGNLDNPIEAVFRDLELELAKVEEIGKFDISTDVAASQINILNDAIKTLVTEGVGVSDPAIQKLQARINGLKVDDSVKVFGSLEKELGKIQKLSSIGLNPDGIKTQIGVIQAAMVDLIDKGLDPMDAKIVYLNDKIQELKAPNVAELFKKTKDELNAVDLKFNLGIKTDVTAEKISILEDAVLNLAKSGLSGTEAFTIFSEKLKEFQTQVEEDSEKLKEVTIGLDGVFAGVGESLGQLFSGDGGASAFFGNILGIVGEFAQGLGKQMIAVGAAGLALKKTFTNPFAAIAAGVALVALGGLVKNKIARGIPSLDIGTRRVNSDGLAILHKGEEVRPADVVQGGYYKGSGYGNMMGVTILRGNDLHMVNQATIMLRKRIA